VEYENRQPAENINVSDESPLRTFFVFLAGAVVLILLIYVTLNLLGGWAARKIPFATEVEMVDAVTIQFPDLLEEPDAGSVDATRLAALRDLTDRIVAKMALPEGMKITVHHVDSDEINAFATFGGHIFILQGLIDKMPNENALAMVVAHEIAHVKHRDPISGLGGGLTSSIAIATLFGYGKLTDGLITPTLLLGGASFSRGMESSADESALHAVNALYGHVAGADSLFRLLGESTEEFSTTPEWSEKILNTHPLDSDRIAAIEALAREAGWALSGEMTPMSADLRR